MIFVKLVSGLGNQLFQYAVGRQLSLIRGTELKLDISFFENQALRKYKLDYFNIQACVADQKEVDSFLSIYHSNSVCSKLKRKVLLKMPCYEHRYFVERELWSYRPEIWKVPKSAYIEGYWQHYRYYLRMRPEIAAELTLRQDELFNYSVLRDIVYDENSVSIHIRRGDYISDVMAKDVMGILPLSYYNKAIEYISSIVKKPSFYIFSDDLQWAHDNLQTPFPSTMVDIENGTKDYLELIAMSRCRHNIIANSSYSWWGAHLNKNVSKTVICPKEWTNPEKKHHIAVQQPTWIKL